MIDRAVRPLLSLDRWQGGTIRFDEGPVLAWISVWPNGTLINPPAESVNLLARQRFALGRHEVIRIGCRDAPDHFAFIALSRYDGGLAGFSAAQRRVPLIEAQIAFLFVGAVALGTAFDEDRFDIASKIDYPWARRRAL